MILLLKYSLKLYFLKKIKLAQTTVDLYNLIISCFVVLTEFIIIMARYGLMMAMVGALALALYPISVAPYLNQDKWRKYNMMSLCLECIW